MNGRRLLAIVALFGAATGFFVFLASARALETWLFFRLALYGLACLVFLGSALSLGHVAVSCLWPGARRTHEHLALSLAIGTFGFEMLVFAFGLFDLYATWAFFALPALALLMGGRSLGRWLRRRLGALSRARARSAPRPAWHGPLLAFGWVCLGLLWFSMLTPDNVQFDSRWKHLAIAEDFIVTGGVRRFPEGWIFAARPHSSSFLYLWGLLAPGAQLYDQMVLSMHLELTVFLGTTLWGIPALVRRLVRGADVRLVWVARFLFPGVMLYDGNLSAGADHLGALLAPALALAMLRVWRRPGARGLALMGVLLAAAFQVKETVALMLGPPVVILLGVRLLLELRHRPRVVVLWGLAGVGAFFVAAAPHLLSNLVWYGDPLYPNLWRHFDPHPWMPSAPFAFETVYRDSGLWQPNRDLGGVLRTVRATFDFSFDPNNWGPLHGELPIVGSLYTLLLPVALCLRMGRRFWALVGMTQLGLFGWFWVHHQDRYLQVLMPFMAAVTAAVLVRAWRELGGFGRVGVFALVGVQVVWAGDVPFIPTHSMIRDSPIRASAELLGKSLKASEAKKRLEIQPEQTALGRKLPDGARLLMHEEHTRLGIRAQWITDYPGEQYAISYGDTGSAAEVWDTLHALGATHVAWKPTSRAYDSVAGDVRFFDTVNRFFGQAAIVGSYRLVTLPETRPAEPEALASGQVLVLGCADQKNPTYASGLYPFDALRVRPQEAKAVYPPPAKPVKDANDAVRLVGEADAMVLDPRCHTQVPPALRERFEKRAEARSGGRGPILYQVWTLPRTPRAAK